MTRSASSRRPHALWGVILAVVVLCVAVSGFALSRSGSAGASPPDVAPPAPLDASGPSDGTDHGAITEADGILPDDATVFEDGYPGITRLSPDLLTALRAAAQDASQDGVVIHVNSGWRSAEYQEQLLRDARSQYGSAAEAARWVATPATSAHVAGDAVDIGSYDAVDWMSRHGSVYGLCQVYDNEAWHFELRPAAVAGGCPRPYTDPTQDPRMQG
ncbi:M15 family metallopeptidase [Microbacterium timonense]|uniref:M15 family metallopeptidase n=1 Tax=Microbacterium timonense TaxID=2086576 RepID=UPI000D0EF39E|nr:M15 family metallopeptidase [Microbacterium timonense]